MQHTLETNHGVSFWPFNVTARATLQTPINPVVLQGTEQAPLRSGVVFGGILYGRFVSPILMSQPPAIPILAIMWNNSYMLDHDCPL